MLSICGFCFFSWTSQLFSLRRFWFSNKTW